MTFTRASKNMTRVYVRVRVNFKSISAPKNSLALRSAVVRYLLLFLFLFQKRNRNKGNRN